MRICLVYDCLFPHTVGGAERWYRNLAERLAADGHNVTYVTMRQWERGELPGIPGVDVRAVGPRMHLYTSSGRRRISQALVFGAGVLFFLLRRGRHFDAVHTASFPYFSLLSAGAARRRGRYRLVVDWHEVWTREYWIEYVGGLGGRIGWWVQLLCARVPQRAFCFSQLHARRLSGQGLPGEVVVLRGEYDGPLHVDRVITAAPLVVFAGRLIPEKRVELAVASVAAARTLVPGLRAIFYGDGPERAALDRAIRDYGLEDVASAPGFVSSERVQADIRRALCLLLTSRREGYGMVVVEAAAAGTPTVVIAGDDNAAVELIVPRINGLVVERAEANSVAHAIKSVFDFGSELRAATGQWFDENAPTLMLDASIAEVLDRYSERR